MTKEKLQELHELQTRIEYTEGDLRAAKKLNHNIHKTIIFQDENHNEKVFIEIPEQTFNNIKTILIEFYELKLIGLKKEFQTA